MTTDEGRPQKVKCFWQTLDEFDECQRKLERKRQFLRLLRRMPAGACFELNDYRDVWCVYKACNLTKNESCPIKVSVRKTNSGKFKIWVRK